MSELIIQVDEIPEDFYCGADIFVRQAGKSIIGVLKSKNCKEEEGGVDKMNIKYRVSRDEKKIEDFEASYFPLSIACFEQQIEPGEYSLDLVINDKIIQNLITTRRRMFKRPKYVQSDFKRGSNDD